MTKAFQLSCGSATLPRALQAADDLEQILGKIADGRAKPADLPIEPLAVLVQFVRDAADEQQMKVAP